MRRCTVMQVFACRHQDAEGAGSHNAAAELRQLGSAATHKPEPAGHSTDSNLAPATPSYAAPKQDPHSGQPRYAHFTVATLHGFVTLSQPAVTVANAGVISMQLMTGPWDPS